MNDIKIPGLSWQEYSVLRAALRSHNPGKLGEQLKWQLLAKVDYAASKAIGPRSAQDRDEELLIASEYGLDDLHPPEMAQPDPSPSLEFGDFEPARYDENGDEEPVYDASKPGVDLILKYPWALGPLASDV